MRARRMPAILLLCLCVVGVNPAHEQQPSTPSAASSTPPSKGTQIGQIVSDAINTAFPVIGKIMDLFKGGKKNASQQDVDAAVKKAQSDFVAQAKQKVQPLATISKELGVIQAFSTAGVTATQNLATISRLLADNTPDYGKIDTEWGVAKNYLADVLIMKPSDVQTVRNAEIQARIVKLQTARKDLMKRIDDNVDAAKKNSPSFSKSELQSQITGMVALLDGFDALAAVELAMLQADIDDLSKWASSPAGVITFAPREPDSRLLGIIDTAASQAKAPSQEH